LANNGEIVKIILCKIIVPSLLYYLFFINFINLGFFGAQSWDFEKTRVEALFIMAYDMTSPAESTQPDELSQ